MIDTESLWLRGKEKQGTLWQKIEWGVVLVFGGLDSLLQHLQKKINFRLKKNKFSL